MGTSQDFSEVHTGAKKLLSFYVMALFSLNLLLYREHLWQNSCS